MKTTQSLSQYVLLSFLLATSLAVHDVNDGPGSICMLSYVIRGTTSSWYMYADAYSHPSRHSLNKLSLESAPPGTINLGTGYPSPKLLPNELLQKACVDTAARFADGSISLSYGPRAGQVLISLTCSSATSSATYKSLIRLARNPHASALHFGAPYPHV
eukprot:915876-Pyramimonas_sp.AAC.3